MSNWYQLKNLVPTAYFYFCSTQNEIPSFPKHMKSIFFNQSLLCLSENVHVMNRIYSERKEDVTFFLKKKSLLNLWDFASCTPNLFTSWYPYISLHSRCMPPPEKKTKQHYQTSKQKQEK